MLSEKLRRSCGYISLLVLIAAATFYLLISLSTSNNTISTFLLNDVVGSLLSGKAKTKSESGTGGSRVGKTVMSFVMNGMLESARGGVEDHVIFLGRIFPVASVPGILLLGQLLVSPDLLPALPGGVPDVVRHVLNGRDLVDGDGVVKGDPEGGALSAGREGGGRRGGCGRRCRCIASSADGLAARYRIGNGIDELHVLVLLVVD